MKYIKSIFVMTIITSIAGFVVWNWMWMTEMEKKIKAEQSSGMIDNTIVNETTVRIRNENEERTMSVAEGDDSANGNRLQRYQSERPPQEIEKPGVGQAGTGAGPGVGTTPESGKGNVTWIEKNIRPGNKSQSVNPESVRTVAEITEDKTMTVTIKNTSDSVLVNMPQSVIKPDVKVIDVSPHPTSTMPQ